MPGNSQLGIAGITNSPEGGYGGPGGLGLHQAWSEDGPRGLVLHQCGVGEILEAWYYTRAVWCGPGGLVFHQGGAGVVLEAWYYTRAAGTDVVHGATTGWISNGC